MGIIFANLEYAQAYGTVIPFSRENVLKMMLKTTSSVKMLSMAVALPEL